MDFEIRVVFSVIFKNILRQKFISAAKLAWCINYNVQSDIAVKVLAKLFLKKRKK